MQSDQLWVPDEQSEMMRGFLTVVRGYRNDRATMDEKVSGPSRRCSVMTTQASKRAVWIAVAVAIVVALVVLGVLFGGGSGGGGGY